MATAIFHSLRGEKSALLLVKANAFVFNQTPVYVPASAVAGVKEGESIDIPDGYTLVPMVGEDDTVRTTKEGVVLHMLQY
jgi:hypothetical protein